MKKLKDLEVITVEYFQDNVDSILSEVEKGEAYVISVDDEPKVVLMSCEDYYEQTGKTKEEIKGEQTAQD